MKLMDSLKSLFSNKKSIPRILDGKISFETYRHYHLREKGFPESCLREPDRQLVEKFGYFVVEGFDWVLLRKYPELITKTLLSDDFDKNCPKVNTELYRRTIDYIKPCDFNVYMAHLYRDRIFEMDKQSTDIDLKRKYNRGQLSLLEMVLNWDLVKDKNLSLCLREASKGIPPLPGNDILKRLMAKYGDIIRVIAKYDPNNFSNFYLLIGRELQDNNRFAVARRIRTTTEKVVNKIHKGHQYVQNNDYRALFKYSSIESFMRKKKVNPELIDKFTTQLNKLPDKKEFMANLPFNYSHLFSNNDLNVILNAGLQESADLYHYQQEVYGQSDSKIFRLLKKETGGKNGNNE